MKRTILIIAALLFALTIIISLMPVDASEEKSIEVAGIVKSVSEGGVKDLVFELENDKTTYYINRGLENGFELNKAKADFIGKKVVLNYAEGWTILAPFGTTSKHISQISVEGKEVFSEWK